MIGERFIGLLVGGFAIFAAVGTIINANDGRAWDAIGTFALFIVAVTLFFVLPPLDRNVD